MSQWSSDAPIEVGVYWFYGSRFGNGHKAELILVEVFKGSNGISYVSEGNFMYNSDFIGFFMKARFPKVPVDIIQRMSLISRRPEKYKEKVVTECVKCGTIIVADVHADLLKQSDVIISEFYSNDNISMRCKECNTFSYYKVVELKRRECSKCDSIFYSAKDIACPICNGE